MQIKKHGWQMPYKAVLYMSFVDKKAQAAKNLGWLG